jgi:hypothetical protein
MIKLNNDYHWLWGRWRFLLNTDLTSWTNLRASNIGRRLSNAVSVGSENHDFIGIALSATEEKIWFYWRYQQGNVQFIKNQIDLYNTIHKWKANARKISLDL